MSAQRSFRKQTIAELAEATGFSHSAVSKKLARSGLEPVEMRARLKRFDAPAALRVLLCDGELDPRRERAKLDSARAHKADLEARRLEGELVNADQLDRVTIALAGVVSNALQGLGSRLAPRLAAESVPAKCQELVDQTVREILGQLSEGAAAAERRVGSSQDAGAV